MCNQIKVFEAVKFYYLRFLAGYFYRQLIYLCTSVCAFEMDFPTTFYVKQCDTEKN